MNLHEIQQAIQALEVERMGLALPSLAAIESRIQSLGARALLDPTLKGDLETTIFSKAEAERQHERSKAIGHELARLRADLQMAEEFERVSKAQTASALCSQAHQEYIAASKATVRAFRRLMRANANAYNVPGAVRAPEDYRLHLPAVYSQYWIGTVGEYMREALLPFEKSEKEEQQS